jgi:hypothetical protein
MSVPSPDVLTQPAAAAASPRVVTARRALLAAAGLGVLADPLLRNGPAGLGLPVWMAAFAVVLLALLRHLDRPIPAETRAWLSVAMVMA